MNTIMIKAKIKEEQVSHVEAAAQMLFATLETVRPEGVHYASWKLKDSTTFIILLALEDESNPLGALPEFQKFQQDLKEMLAEPVEQEQLQVVGSYRVFG